MRFLLGLLVTLSACATTNPPSVAPPHRDAMAVRWLLDWNDVVGQKLGRGCASHPWHADLERQLGRKPVVRVEGLHNRTAHAIDGEIIARLIERELLLAGVEVSARGPADVTLQGTVDAYPDGDLVFFAVSVHLQARDERRLWSDVGKLRLTAEGERAPGPVLCRAPERP